MKATFRITLLLVLFTTWTSFAYYKLLNDRAIAKKAIVKPNLKGKAAFHQKLIPNKFCSVTLTGNTCVGNTLTVNSSDPVASISWLLNGVSELDQSINKQNNGQVVAGGNGSGSASNQLYNPNRLFIDAAGNLYIPDMANNRIQKWLPGATSGTTIAGGNGVGSAANQFNRPTSVAVDAAGNIYVADQNNSRIQKWAPGATAGITVASSLNTPTGVFIDNSGDLYVSEQNGHCIRRFQGATGTGIIVAGGNGYGSAPNQLAAPTGIFVRNNILYICDTDNSRVQKWAIGASVGTTVARISGNPLGVYVDGSYNIYISDYTGYKVEKWADGANSGVVIAGGNGSGSDPNQIMPVGIGMDSYNNLYVSDFLNGRVIKFGNIYTGTYTTLKAGTYTAKVTTTNGCVSTSNPIVVQDNVTPKITIAANTVVICAQFAPTFTAALENGGANPILQWKINGAVVTNAHANTFTSPNFANGDVVSCELTNQDLCVSNSLAKSNNITLTNIATETPMVTIQSDINGICMGTKVAFKATTKFAGPTPIYNWKVNHNTAVGSTNSDTYESTNLNDQDQVSCSITSSAPYCQTTSNVESESIVLKVFPILNPSIFIGANQTKIYEGSSITFTASPIDGGTTPQYQWYINGKSAGIGAATFTTADLKEGDEVSCKLIVDDACANVNEAFSNKLKINVIKIIKIIPSNAFSPNGDGVNDVWTIDQLVSYPKCIVHVYSRFGVEIFSSVGYKKPWAGDYKNKMCTPGVYYYVINLDNKELVSGSLTILK